jgi:thioredoxin reductase (NADPH)
MDQRVVDVAIVGAGPIGLEMAAMLKRAGVDTIHVDAGQIGYTISWWPRNTHFFSTSERLSIGGIPIQTNHQQRLTGKEYLAYLRAVVEQLDLQVRTYERVTRIERLERGFALCTETQTGFIPRPCPSRSPPATSCWRRWWREGPVTAGTSN